MPTVPGRLATLQQQGLEEWRRRYPLFPRLLVVLDGTGPAGIENRISALRAAALDLVPVWRPVQNSDSRVSWYQPWQER